MGRTVIEDKLAKQFLSKAPLTEARVAYIMLQTRKLMELMNTKQNYRVLCFCASWVAHPKMDQGTTQSIMQLFDEAHPILLKGESLSHELNRKINDVINFHSFKNEFDAFIHAHGLPTVLLNTNWVKFLSLYAAIVEDCPLVASGTKQKHLESVTLKLRKAHRRIKSLKRNQTVFLLSWHCVDKQGRKGTWESYNSI